MLLIPRPALALLLGTTTVPALKPWQTEVQSDSLQKRLQSKGWLVQTPTVQRHESRPSPLTPLFLKQPLPSGNSPDQHTAGADLFCCSEQLA